MENKEDKMIKKILSWLKCEPIRKEIVDIVKEDISKNTKSQDKKKKLKEELTSLQNDMRKQKESFFAKEQSFQEKIDEQNNQIQHHLAKKEQYENSLSHLQNSIEDLQHTNNKLQKKVDNLLCFEKDLEIYNLYQNLDLGIKKSLSNIFKSDTVEGFISCGVQEKNISNFWDYIKNEIIEEKPNTKELIKIFYFFFARYSLAVPYMRLNDDKKDNHFDPILHLKHSSSSSSSGNISEVILLGWENTKTKKRIKQSIVIIN